VIVVGGEALVDLLVGPDGGLDWRPGGGPYNTARTIGRLGSPVAFLGRLSSDAFGGRLGERLAGDRVRLVVSEPSAAPTTLAVAEVDRDGQAAYRFYLTGTAAADLGPAAVPAALDPPPEAIHVGTLGLVMEPVAMAMERLVDRAPPEAIVMVDPNARRAAIPDPAAWRARIARVLDRADVVKVSRDDLAVLDPGTAPEPAARRLARPGRVVLLTAGGEPTLLLAGGSERSVAGPAVTVVDTVGAGDAFGGAFLAWWGRRGLDRAALGDAALAGQATTAAAIVAAMTCERPGASPPTLAEVEARWPRWTEAPTV